MPDANILRVPFPQRPDRYTVQIDKGVPVPPVTNRCRYPFRELEVGDSFLIVGRSIQGCRAHAQYWKQVTGFSFAVRSVDGGVRVWRTA